MSSFIRQLRAYGFHKIIGNGNKDKGSFYHHLFLRGRPGLCSSIYRQKKCTLLFNEEYEPDLSKFDPMPLIPMQNDHIRLRTVEYGNTVHRNIGHQASFPVNRRPQIILCETGNMLNQQRANYQKMTMPGNDNGVSLLQQASRLNRLQQIQQIKQMFPNQQIVILTNSS